MNYRISKKERWLVNMPLYACQLYDKCKDDGCPLNNERKKNWIQDILSAKACLSLDAIEMSLLLRAPTIQFFSSGFIGLDFFAHFLHQGRKCEPVRLEDIKEEGSEKGSCDD